MLVKNEGMFKTNIVHYKYYGEELLRATSINMRTITFFLEE